MKKIHVILTCFFQGLDNWQKQSGLQTDLQAIH